MTHRNHYFSILTQSSLLTYLEIGDIYSRGNCPTITWHRSLLYTTQKTTRLNKTLRVILLITDSDTYNMLYKFAMFWFAR